MNVKSENTLLIVRKQRYKFQAPQKISPMQKEKKKWLPYSNPQSSKQIKKRLQHSMNNITSEKFKNMNTK